MKKRCSSILEIEIRKKVMRRRCLHETQLWSSYSQFHERHNRNCLTTLKFNCRGGGKRVIANLFTILYTYIYLLSRQKAILTNEDIFEKCSVAMFLRDTSLSQGLQDMAVTPFTSDAFFI